MCSDIAALLPATMSCVHRSLSPQRVYRQQPQNQSSVHIMTREMNFGTCTAVWGPAGERTQMISIMRGMAEKLATGVQVLGNCTS